MLNKQQQYKQLYKQFETAFWKLYKFAEKNKKHIEWIDGSEHLIESIDEWAVEFEGAIDLAKQNRELCEKLGID